MGTRVALVAGAVLVVVSVLWGWFSDEAAREWENRAQRALVAEAEATARADSLREHADSVETLALETAGRADTVTVRAVRKVTEIREIPVPEECEEVVAPRDSVIDSLVVATDHWRSAFNRQMEVVADLRSADDVRSAVVDSLRSVIEDRPRPRPWWRPQVGPAVFTGYCQSGPCAGVGVALQWKVP